MTEKATLPLSRLREIGWHFWDPIGLLPEGADWKTQTFIDEYDVYLLHVAFSLQAGWSAELAIAYLVQAEVEAMGLGLRSTTKDRAVSTVTALRTALRL
ncbi:MAG: hypothetical protein O9342_10540 [Beijerinckiaceae bacterium]|nr:hypothetical protein [Beijerinckiaceae bacterium]